jgi:uncharacterized protein YpuA (DUF1002 family)
MQKYPQTPGMEKIHHNINIDPNNVSYLFGKLETQINSLIESQKLFQNEMKNDIDQVFSKYRETNDQIFKIQNELQKLDNKIEDTKMIVDRDTIKRQRDFLLSIIGFVISILTSLIVAWISFKSGWK